MRHIGTFMLYIINAGLIHGPRNILRHNWHPRSDFPCQHIKWTCEHVIPRSLIREHNDLHNLILLPDRLNNIRSNYPYIRGIEYDEVHNPHLKVKTVCPCARLNCSCDLQGKLVSGCLFIPPDRFKGMIGRSVLYMKDKYPHHKNLIHTRVLDLGVACVWSVSFPPSQKEKEWNEFIYSHQGDYNPYTLFNAGSHK